MEIHTGTKMSRIIPSITHANSWTPCLGLHLTPTPVEAEAEAEAEADAELRLVSATSFRRLFPSDGYY